MDSVMNRIICVHNFPRFPMSNLVLVILEYPLLHFDIQVGLLCYILVPMFGSFAMFQMPLLPFLKRVASATL
jgi:hypothetical protein